MWPFSHKEKHSPDLPEAFLTRLDTLEHDFKLIRIEWAEIYDKIVHQFERERKRKGKALSDAELVESPNSAAGVSDQLSSGNWQDPVFIMEQARRRGL